ncbi:hypothetical protein BKA70DRAFT_1367014 [Coprinopsis sp. MPI-PUGE-AT-0042]|nr:hypothetical protein BKA70DRAFT_1367014 [Coprinopsis sp. MPI-PUGE-AT-0042]
MAPPSASGSKRKSTTQMGFGGMDEDFLMSIVSKIPKNPVTGKVEMSDVLKFLEKNPDDMASLMDKVDTSRAAELPEDLSTYNYAPLAKKIKKDDVWVLQMESNGFVDKSGKYIQKEAANVPGAKPVFLFYCYDLKTQCRLTHQHEGLPTSDIVTKIIQKAIVAPVPPLKPALPSMFMLSIRLEQHQDNLRSFLDSLPEPFSWRFETREEANDVTEGVWKLNKKGYKAYMDIAEREKAAGNKAFAANKRKAALNAYEKAIDALSDASGQALSLEEEKKVKRMLAICYSNRAATHMMPGPGLNVQKALDDGQVAEKADPSYNKCYVRQAAAFQHLKQYRDAVEAITRALRRKELESDTGLVDKLVEILTDGKGLSDDEGVFKNWIIDVSINDPKSGEMLKGLGGEWKRRINAHFARWPRRGES